MNQATSTPIASTGVRRVMRDGLWLVLGESLAAAGMLGGVRIITGAVSPSVYATSTLLYGMVTVARNLFYQPFMQAALRFYPEAAKTDTAPTLRRVLLWYLAYATVITLPIAIVIGLACNLAGEISIGTLAVLLITLVIESIRLMEVGLLNAARRQAAVCLLRPYDAWSRSLLAVLMATLIGPTDFSILLGYLAAAMTGYGLMFAVGIKPVGYDPLRPASTDDPERVANLRKRIWQFAVPMAPIAIVEWTLLFSNRYILGGLAGLEAAGVYTAGCSLAATPFIMSQTAVENWLRPVYFEAVEEGDPVRSRRIFSLYIGTTAGICFAGVLGLILVGPFVAQMMLDVRYRSIGPLLPVIGLGNSLYAICQVVEKYFHVHHRMQLCLVARTVGAIACVGVTIPMVYWFGLSGAAWSAPVYFGIQLLLTIALTRLIDDKPE